MHGIMGLGPWYRIGLSISNALILVAIIDTIVTCNAASHSLGYTLACYHYGKCAEDHKDPGKLADDIVAHPEWLFFAVVLILQIIADIMLWFAVIIKGNKHFAVIWVITTIVKTFYAAYVETERVWDQTYEVSTALQRIFSFLWGTVLFGFCIVSGTETYFHLTSEEGRVKLSPIGQGICAIKDYYREVPSQLAVVLLISEIAVNVHRSFHYPVTAYLMEASKYLEYAAPNEYGIDISIATIVINALGLILLAFKNSGARKAWVTLYVIIMLAHFILLVYVVIDWSPVNIHPHFFNGFIFISGTHLVYKVGILLTFRQSSL